MKSYQDLTAWQKVFALCVDVYEVTKRFPKTETYALASQMQRAAVSIPSNIAEGFGRRTTADFLHSLYIAYGSICELETQILLTSKLGYQKLKETERLRQELGDAERLTKALIKSLEKKRSAGQSRQ
ncbi:MAG: four helix bundle protein [candidate division WOR-3 bacterium]|nr:MAG: four helix bundle protein [candidate division WOR-3 bacterium]